MGARIHTECGKYRKESGMTLRIPAGVQSRQPGVVGGTGNVGFTAERGKLSLKEV